MVELTEQAILECLAEALESSAFISIEPAPAEYAAPAQSELLALQFNGMTSGKVQLAAPSGFGAILAANILALDAASPEALAAAQDAVKELCNVTAGTLLSRLFEGGDAFPEMMLPAASAMTSSEWDAFLKQPGTSVVFAEGMPLAVRAVLEQPS